jgi:hypothetical protein
VGSISFASNVASQRGVELVGLRLSPASLQRPGLHRLGQAHLDTGALKLARDPAPAAGRLDRDRDQPTVPLGEPPAERLSRRRQPRLDQLATLRVERRRLEHVLVDVDRCVQHSHWGLLCVNATTVDRPSEAPFDEIRSAP